jgi:hypothetical protein
MSVRYTIDRPRRLILTIAEGHVTFEDIRSHQNRLLADPGFDATFDQLIDATTASQFEISSDEARLLAQRRVVSAESRRAFVATEPHIFGLGRMMEIYHTDLKYAHVYVFNSVDEALKWLNRQEKESPSDVVGTRSPSQVKVRRAH